MDGTLPPDAFAYAGRDLEAMACAGRYHRWIHSVLAPHIVSPVAEVGAGIGQFSRLLLDSGIGDLTAFEPSPNLHPRLRRTLADDPRARVRPLPFDGTGCYRTMLYVNVLEHIADDGAEVQKAAAALAPGGKLVIFVPAIPALYSKLDASVGHHRRYTRKRLTRIIGDAGLEVERLHGFDIFGVLPWYLVYTLLGAGINPASVSAYDRLAGVLAAIERRFVPRIGKNLIAVASAARDDVTPHPAS